MGIVVIGCTKEEADKGNDNNNNKTEQPDENGGGSEDGVPENIFFGLDKENVTISPDGGSVDILVYSNYKWEISGISDWCTPSVKTGNANEDGQKVTFSADVAYDDREATFWFRCADEKIKFVVSQKFKKVIISDANNTFNIPAEGGIAVISNKTTVDCEVIIPEEAKDWITFAPATRGLVSENINLDIAENTTYSLRSAIVKVVAMGNAELLAEYTITQDQIYCFLYYTSSDGKIVTPTNSSSFDATITSNSYKDGVGVIKFNAPITAIGDFAFCFCSSLTSVTIPDSVTAIGGGAFHDCSSLTSVKIGDSVTAIGDSAFHSCSSLTSVTIGDSVTAIGCDAFLGCSSLTSVTIGDSVTAIGEGAFSACSSLTSVTIGDSVTAIGRFAFSACSSLTSVTIPDSVTAIGRSAFYSCSSLREFKGKLASEDGRCLIIDGVLNSFAPAGLTEYSIPDSVTAIGGDAFLGCSSLTSVTIGDSVTAIGSFAFCFCSSLTSVTIPDSVTAIGADAFYGCSSLIEVYCKPTTPPAGDFAMFSDNASGRKIYVPTASVEAYKSASDWDTYASDIVGYNF